MEIPVLCNLNEDCPELYPAIYDYLVKAKDHDNLIKRTKHIIYNPLYFNDHCGAITLGTMKGYEIAWFLEQRIRVWFGDTTMYYSYRGTHKYSVMEIEWSDEYWNTRVHIMNNMLVRDYFRNRYDPEKVEDIICAHREKDFRMMTQDEAVRHLLYDYHTETRFSSSRSFDVPEKQV